jgi:hypothetical protein
MVLSGGPFQGRGEHRGRPTGDVAYEDSSAIFWVFWELPGPRTPRSLFAAAKQLLYGPVVLPDPEQTNRVRTDSVG